MLWLFLACAHHAEPAPDPGAPPNPGAALEVFHKWCLDVRARVYQHLAAPPEAAAHPEVETWVDVTVDPSGAITSSSVSRSSGFPAIDDAILAAVKAAAPLPKPPKEDQEILAQGVTFKVRAVPAS